MPDLIAEKTVTARTARCRCCHQRITPGTKYRRSTFVHDGSVYNWQTCRACEEITSQVFDWVDYIDEGITSDNYREWANDALHDPHAHAAARAYLDRADSEDPS